MRVLVIGGGTMGSTHANAHRRMVDVELVGIVDPYEKGKALASQLEVPHFAFVDEIDATAFDVVDVCVPTFLHRRYVEWAANLGKHVFCEKPIALTVEDAMAMVEACERNGVRMSVGHCVRFFPEYLAARQAILRNYIGHVAVARLFRGGSHPRPTTWNDWYASENLSGGVMMDLMIHDFDFLRWVFGPVKRVYAKSIRGEANRIGLALVTLRFENGTIAHVEGSWAHQGFGTRYEFAGSEGILAHDSSLARPLVVQTNESQGGSQAVHVPGAPTSKNPYQLELEDFIRNLREDRDFRVTPNDAIEALRISLAAIQSSVSGQPVDISPMPISPMDIPPMDSSDERRTSR